MFKKNLRLKNEILRPYFNCFIFIILILSLPTSCFKNLPFIAQNTQSTNPALEAPDYEAIENVSLCTLEAHDYEVIEYVSRSNLNFSLSNLFENITRNVILASLNRLKRDTKELKDVIKLQCEKVKKEDSHSFHKCDFLEKIQEPFLNAMNSYHFMETFPIGEEIDPQNSLAYTQYDVFNRIKKLARNPQDKLNETDPADFSVLEYLIFASDLENVSPCDSEECPPPNETLKEPEDGDGSKESSLNECTNTEGQSAEEKSPPNEVSETEGSGGHFSIFHDDQFQDDVNQDTINSGDQNNWNTLSLSQKFQYRCQYMEYVVSSVLGQIENLHSSWKPIDGDLTKSKIYKDKFKTYDTFVIEVTKGINFFDTAVKDTRLATPIGNNKNSECWNNPCPERSEHLLSGNSISSLLYTSKGLLALFTGNKINENLDVDISTNSGIGLEDLLAEKRHSELSKNFKSAILDVIKYINQLLTDDQKVTLKSLINEKSPSACQLWKKVKTVTDIYKGEIIPATGFGPSIGSTDSD